MRDRGGVPVAKRRTVVAFELDSRLVLASQKCQQSQEWRGSWSRNAELSSLLDLRCVFASQNEGSGGVPVAKRRTVVAFELDSRLVLASQKCQQSQEWRGSWSRNAELSSLLDLRCVFASQNEGSGKRSRSRNAELSPLLNWTRVWSSRLKNVNSLKDCRGPGRETPNYRRFWTCVGSSHLKSVNSQRDRGGPGGERERERERE